MAATHRYSATCTWTGSTGAGYDAYDRTHTATAPPAEPTLTLAADPAFHGDPARLNPEQLLVLAASSCQLLSFLAVCSRARVDCRRYDDTADAVMPEDDEPVRITRIVLRPRIEIAGRDRPPSEERVRHLVEVAHRECYVANSLRTEVVVEPAIVFVDG